MMTRAFQFAEVLENMAPVALDGSILLLLRCGRMVQAIRCNRDSYLGHAKTSTAKMSSTIVA
jgi:hypothetical protein